jgi:hypothetical protein
MHSTSSFSSKGNYSIKCIAFDLSISPSGIQFILQFSLMVFQQQHSSKLQLGQSLEDELILHSLGEQLQSQHLILIW